MQQDSERPPWQQRVVDEVAELDARLDKLTKFIGDHRAFDAVPYAERGRLANQHREMRALSVTLHARIDNNFQ